MEPEASPLHSLDSSRSKPRKERTRWASPSPLRSVLSALILIIVVAVSQPFPCE